MVCATARLRSSPRSTEGELEPLLGGGTVKGDVLGSDHTTNPRSEGSGVLKLTEEENNRLRSLVNKQYVLPQSQFLSVLP